MNPNGDLGDRTTAFRAGGAFDTRVGRDHDAAEDRRASRELAKILARLEVVGVAHIDTRKLLVDGRGAGAATVVEHLWPKPPISSTEHNDLAVALAWLHDWDSALAELVAAENAKGASDTNRKRAVRNRKVVLEARIKANC